MAAASPVAPQFHRVLRQFNIIYAAAERLAAA
jgi:hypothetical protein